MSYASPLSDDAGALDRARAVLRTYFGYPEFRPAQRPAVEAVLSGRDALLLLPTGGGKSLCYQVPALVRDGLTIVVSPLISLMTDQVDALIRRGISAAFINSTLSAADAADRMARVRAGTLKLLYLAPERLDVGSTAAALRESGVALLAVDEAHCISEWGHDFRPSYRRLGDIRVALGTPQTVALTATATPHVRQDIVRQLGLRQPEVVVGGFDRTNLTYHVTPVRSPAERDASAITWLRHADGPAVVYAPTRVAVERVTATLVRGRIRATAYHAGLAPALRQRSQDAFMEGRARVIVATSAFGMGIDKPDVRLVVHHAMPGTLEAYYQEAGRAGRDGQRSVCVLLHSASDRRTHEFFIASAHPSRRLIERTWNALRAVADAEGVVARSVGDLTALLSSGSNPREVAAALRVLIVAGACRAEPPPAPRIWVRLLATPTRIRRELTGVGMSDREVLRTLWRAAGAALETGAWLDLDALTRGGGSTEVVPALERLAARQFVMWVKHAGGFRLDPRARTAPSAPVDWRALQRRQRAEIGRLDAMQQYAQTHHCRRAFVLRYFGDTDTRTSCGACDRCLGTTPPSVPVEAPRTASMRPAPRTDPARNPAP